MTAPPHPTERQLADLFRAAGAAHHRAFASTNGEDAEWPAWYAEYLAPRLHALAGRPFDIQHLAGTLQRLDAELRELGSREPWPEFYARVFRDRHWH